MKEKERLGDVPEIPDENNLYGVIYVSNIREEELAIPILGKIIWSCRKCSWDEFELLSDWGEFVLAKDGNEHLLSGSVDPNYFHFLAKKLKSLGFSFSLELYREGQILDIVSNKS